MIVIHAHYDVDLLSKCCVIICIQLCLRDTQGCLAYLFVLAWNSLHERDIPRKFGVSTQTEPG